jgi:hypothetical protein
MFRIKRPILRFRRVALTCALTLGAIVTPAVIGVPLHAFACTLTVSATPTSQTVRPSYGQQATITASYTQGGGGCAGVNSIGIGWGDGQSSTSGYYVTSYTASHTYSPPSGTNQYQITIYLNTTNGLIVDPNAASVTTIGCPPSCTPVGP